MCIHPIAFSHHQVVEQRRRAFQSYLVRAPVGRPAAAALRPAAALWLRAAGQGACVQRGRTHVRTRMHLNACACARLCACACTQECVRVRRRKLLALIGRIVSKMTEQ